MRAGHTEKHTYAYIVIFIFADTVQKSADVGVGVDITPLFSLIECLRCHLRLNNVLDFLKETKNSSNSAAKFKLFSLSSSRLYI